MREPHTGTHVLNALVFQAFNGALVIDVPAYLGHLFTAGGRTRATRTDPFEVGDTSRNRRRPDSHRGDRGSGSSSMRQHPPVRNRSLAPNPHSENRQQGPAQPSRMHWLIESMSAEIRS